MVGRGPLKGSGLMAGGGAPGGVRGAGGGAPVVGGSRGARPPGPAWRAAKAKAKGRAGSTQRRAGDRDRTGMASLEGWGSAIELHPRRRGAGWADLATRRLEYPVRWGGDVSGRSVVASAPALGAGDREFE